MWHWYVDGVISSFLWWYCDCWCWCCSYLCCWCCCWSPRGFADKLAIELIGACENGIELWTKKNLLQIDWKTQEICSNLYESEIDICGVYIGLIVLQKPWLKLNLGGERDGADDVGVIKLDGVERWWLPFSNGLCISPMMLELWESAMLLPMCGLWLWSILFILEELFAIFALGFVSVEEFVSLAQLISLLLTFKVLLLFGVDNRCVRNFSSRLHLALEKFENRLNFTT